MLLDMHLCLVHSLAVVEVIVLLGAVSTVAVLEGVVAKDLYHQRCHHYSSICS